MFEFLVNTFDILLYKPLFNSLVFLYNNLSGHDFGIAVVLLTVIIRFILYPISIKAINSQKTLQKLQPQMQEIQVKYKNDKERLAKETMELYKKEKINPFSGLFLALIQLPILIALYRVFWLAPGQINAISLGFVDLSKPNMVLAITAGILQFFQTKQLAPKTAPKKTDGPDMAGMMQKQMLYFFPIMTIIILFSLPSAIGLYWTVSGIFSVVQQYFLLKKNA